MRLTRPAFLLIAAALAAPAAGADGAGHFGLDRWNTDAGLPQASVNAVRQSRDGYLWVATLGGVARFDGTSFTVLPGSDDGLPSERALGLAEDPAGRIWIATEGGLARYDHGTFVTFDESRGLPHNQVRAIAVAPDGSAWFGTANGALGWIDAEGGIHKVIPPLGALGVTVRQIVVDTSGAIWVLAGAGVYRIEPGTESPLLVRPRLAFPGGSQEAIAAGPAGNVWMVTEQGLRLAGATAARDFPLRRGDGPLPAQIRSLAGGLSGELWIGTMSGDIYRFDPDAGSMSLIQSTGPGTTTDLAVDREGSVWVGNRFTGLSRVRPLPIKVLTIADGLAQDNARGLLRDSQGRVWIGGECGGVAVRPVGAARFEPVRRPGLPGCVWTIAEDHEGGIWLGGRGVARIDKGTVRSFTSAPGWPKTGVRVLFTDSAGVVWIGGNFGLLSIDGSRPVRHNGDPRRPIRNVRLIQSDPEGGLWLGTGDGLTRYAAGQARSWTRADGLRSNDVRAIHRDRSGAIWIGMYGGGLARMAGGRIRQFTSAEGIHDSFLSAIVEDDRGLLWLSGDRGIARVARAELEEVAAGTRSKAHAVEYGRADGMLSSETNGGFQGSSALIDGRFWFPTLMGVATIDPAAAFDPVPPAVAVDAVLINGRTAALLPTLVAGRGSADVEFGYSGLSLKAPHAVTFRYRLDGWDTDWIEAGARRSANYSRLPPGTYHFSVSAANRYGVWSRPTAAVTVRVLPQYWQTWWFRTLLLLALAALPLALLARMRQRRRQLEAIVAERTRALGDAVARLSESEHSALLAKDAALEASHAKSLFLANMSHELRTPLNAVIGFSQMLARRDTLKGEDRESAQIIQRSGEHLLGLINDVLSLSKIEAGSLTLESAPFDLRALIEAVRSIISSRIEGRAVALRFEVGEDLPAAVIGDEGRLRQVLINLLGNAVKFTEHGEVRLSASWSEGRARFAVLDTGPGIAASEIPQLFSAFVQTESGRRSREGTGLGLAISAQIVRLMGGEILVESRVGAGSTFSFDIPLAIAEAVPVVGGEHRVRSLLPGEKHVRILVVDDVEENRRLLREALGACGIEVLEAADGEQALARIAEFHPDLVLMDVRMKGMDGREVTRRLRAREALDSAPRTAVIALTASAFEHDRLEMLEAGADDFLAKPFRLETLFEKIAGLLGIPYTSEDESAPRAAPSDSPISKARFASVPDALRLELLDALSSGRARRARETAERIAALDEALGSALLAEIRSFRMDALLSQLTSEGGADS